MPRPRSRVRLRASPDKTRPGRLAGRVVPAVDPWVAAEMFVSPHVEERRRGFALLFGTEAVRRSPLTPQILAARLHEPDLELRASIVRALADYFEVRGGEYRYPPELRAGVVDSLRRLDHSQLLALLELHQAVQAGEVSLPRASLARLAERLADASARLARIASDRAAEVDLRRAAVELIGQVGFTDAVPALEGLAQRLEGRRAGQLSMTFAPTVHPDDHALLPTLQETLRVLQEDA